MPAKKSAGRKTKGTARRPARSGKSTGGFTAEEREAMRERAREAKAAGGHTERDVLEKIAGMEAEDRAMAGRLHAIIMDTAPALAPRLWYGMPAYARDGSVVCFVQGARKFKTRYCTLGFSDKARLDDGPMWPTSFAVEELTAETEARIRALVKKAVG